MNQDTTLEQNIPTSKSADIASIDSDQQLKNKNRNSLLGLMQRIHHYEMQSQSHAVFSAMGRLREVVLKNNEFEHDYRQIVDIENLVSIDINAVTVLINYLCRRIAVNTTENIGGPIIDALVKFRNEYL